MLLNICTGLKSHSDFILIFFVFSQQFIVVHNTQIHFNFTDKDTIVPLILRAQARTELQGEVGCVRGKTLHRPNLNGLPQVGPCSPNFKCFQHIFDINLITKRIPSDFCHLDLIYFNSNIKHLQNYNFLFFTSPFLNSMASWEELG